MNQLPHSKKKKKYEQALIENSRSKGGPQVWYSNDNLSRGGEGTCCQDFYPSLAHPGGFVTDSFIAAPPSPLTLVLASAYLVFVHEGSISVCLDFIVHATGRSIYLRCLF